MNKIDKVLKNAIHFHGHLGPYLVLGVRAGLYANEILGRSPMKMKAAITSPLTPPQSCFIDGIQITTGCTTGKNNIKLIESSELSVTFDSGTKKLKLILLKEIIDAINSLPAKENAWEDYAHYLYKADIAKLFVPLLE